jgi:hypothetical protein
MLLLIPEKEIDINKELETFVSWLLFKSDSQIKASIKWGCQVILAANRYSSRLVVYK